MVKMRRKWRGILFSFQWDSELLLEKWWQKGVTLATVKKATECALKVLLFYGR